MLISRINEHKNLTVHSHSRGHLFHLVDLSPWPIVTSISLFVLTTGATMYFNGYENGGLTVLYGLGLVILNFILWFRDIIREGLYQGNHTHIVEKGLKIGVLLFFLSEVLIFATFFWAFFHSSLSPNVELGSVWPPIGTEVINPWAVPFLNAILLLTSGGAVTWAHNHLIEGGTKGYKGGIISITSAIIMGIGFLGLQYFEFSTAPFTMSDGAYGTTFFSIVGLHGLHVIIGVLWLIVSLYRLWSYQITNKHHLGIETGFWYYHLVDFIYLAVFAFVYWWGTGDSYL